MKLIIDCFKQVKGAGKSIGIYNLTKNLVAHLAEENEYSHKIEEIIVLGNSQNRQDFALKGISFVEIPYDPLNKLRFIYWELFQVKRYMKSCKGDRILFPRGYAPLFFRGKDTIIIHDLIPFYYHKNYPGVFDPLENFYIMWRLKASMRHADRIITISDYSRQEIERIVPGVKEKINVIYNGLNDLPQNETARVRDQKSREERPYLCAMASKLPHKNAKGILEAYRLYWNNAEKPLPLKLIGLPSVEEFDIGEAARDVICYPYVKDDAELYDMIGSSQCFLFLSLIEGFGFPPLEAMQLKTPVICSDRTSLPEVVKEAALLTDPENPIETAEKIERLLKDRELQEKLIAAGEENCLRFDWGSRTKLYMEELIR